MRPDMQKFSISSANTLYSNIAAPEAHSLWRLRCMSALLFWTRNWCFIFQLYIYYRTNFVDFGWSHGRIKMMCEWTNKWAHVKANWAVHLVTHFMTDIVSESWPPANLMSRFSHRNEWVGAWIEPYLTLLSSLCFFCMLSAALGVCIGSTCSEGSILFLWILCTL